MRTSATFLFALLLSTAVSLLICLVVLYAIPAWDRIAPMLVWTVASAFASLAAFGIGYNLAKQKRTLDWIAIILAATVLVPLGLIPAVMTVVRWPAANKEFLAVAFTILMPTALTILIQWWLIRRRWRRARLQ